MSILRKSFRLLTINNLLSLAFTLYIGNVIHGLWQMSQVPVANPDTSSSGRVQSHMNTGQKFDVQLYLSDSIRFDTNQTVYVGSFTDLRYEESMYRMHEPGQVFI